MNYILFLFLFSFYTGLIAYTIYNLIVKGEIAYLIWLIILLFPIYTHVLSISYMVTGSRVLVNVLRVSKDSVFLLTVVVFILYQHNPLTKRYRIVRIDYLIVMFFGIAFIYMLLPVGEATFFNKVVYFKNMSLMGIAYFIGRNCYLDTKEILKTGYIILWISVIAFIVGLFEKLSGTHLHSITGYINYQMDFANAIQTGNYGLTWTFEASDGSMRFASIFSNPLEFAASMLLCLSVSIYFLFNSQSTFSSVIFFCTALISLANIFLAYSRASLFASVILIISLIILYKNYRLLAVVLIIGSSILIYTYFSVSEDTKYFIIDTLLFQESSSMGHVLEWLNAIESILINPEGIGLASSGSGGILDEEIHIGGENQFLIYGVQLGIAGLIIYMLMTYELIKSTYYSFQNSTNRMQRFYAHTAFSVKLALLIPMMTSNADYFQFLTLTIFFISGVSISFVKEETKGTIRISK